MRFTTLLLILIALSSCESIYLTTRLLSPLVPRPSIDCIPSTSINSTHKENTWYQIDPTTTSTDLRFNPYCGTILIEAMGLPTPPLIMATEPFYRRHWAVGQLLLTLNGTATTNDTIVVTLSSNSATSRFKWKRLDPTPSPQLIYSGTLSYSQTMTHTLPKRTYIYIEANCSLSADRLFHQRSIHHQQRVHTVLYGYADSISLLYELDDPKRIYSVRNACHYTIQSVETTPSTVSPIMGLRWDDRSNIRPIFKRWVENDLIEVDLPDLSNDLIDTITNLSSLYGPLLRLSNYNPSPTRFDGDYSNAEILSLERIYSGIGQLFSLNEPDPSVQPFYGDCVGLIDRQCSYDAECPDSTCGANNRCRYNTTYILGCVAGVADSPSFSISDALTTYSVSPGSPLHTSVSWKIDQSCDDHCPVYRTGYLIDDSDCSCPRFYQRLVVQPVNQYCNVLNLNDKSLCDPQNTTMAMGPFHSVCDGPICVFNISANNLFCDYPNGGSTIQATCYQSSNSSMFNSTCIRNRIRVASSYCNTPDRHRFDPTVNYDPYIGYNNPLRFSSVPNKYARYNQSSAEFVFDWESFFLNLTRRPKSFVMQLAELTDVTTDRLLPYSEVTGNNTVTLVNDQIVIISSGAVSIQVALSGRAVSLECRDAIPCDLIVCVPERCSRIPLNSSEGARLYGTLATTLSLSGVRSPLVPLVISSSTTMATLNLTNSLSVIDVPLTLYGDLVLNTGSKIIFTDSTPPITIHGCINGSGTIHVASLNQEERTLFEHNGCIDSNLGLVSAGNAPDSCYQPALSYGNSSIALVYRFDCMNYVYAGIGSSIFLVILVVAAIVVYLKVRVVRDKIAPYHYREETLDRSKIKPFTPNRPTADRGFNTDLVPTSTAPSTN